MLTRRGFLAASAAFGSSGVSSLRADDAQSNDWSRWRTELEATAAQVKRRGWSLTELAIEPPARPSTLRDVEKRYGMAVPPQLREVLLNEAATVKFGWTIPQILQPLDGLDLPTSGGLDGLIWSLDQLDGRALDAFRGLKSDRVQGDEDEASGTSGLWDHQFPWMVLRDGDILTLDVSKETGPHPVRFFESDSDGFSGRLLAPDLKAFISAYVALRCAGSALYEWIRFMPSRDEGPGALDADCDDARRWLAWFWRAPDERHPDEPPPAIPAKTRADFDLIETARAGSARGVMINLASGAMPDCVDGRDHGQGGSYSVTFETALVYALRRDDVATAERLLEAGASLDTRRIALTECFRSATIATARWVLKKGGRVNGWTGERVPPLHALLVAFGDDSQLSDADRLALLDAILKAGADPNARGGGARTVLMTAGPKASAMLLVHGADPNLVDLDHNTALHLARDPQKAALLLRHGADVNLLPRPASPADLSSDDPPHTPVQSSLAAGERAVVDVLLRSGADLRKRDAAGRNSLWYCRTTADVDLCLAAGCDPQERDRGGATLVMAVVQAYGGDLAASDAGPLLLDRLLRHGVDINAARNDGATALHLMSRWGNVESLGLLLGRGADRTARDKRGRLAADLVPQARTEARALLADDRRKPDR